MTQAAIKLSYNIISIERIIDKFLKRFLLKNISSTADAILGLHAITGCNTVSAFWRKGKVRPLKLLLTNDQYIFPCALLENTTWELVDSQWKFDEEEGYEEDGEDGEIWWRRWRNLYMQFMGHLTLKELARGGNWSFSLNDAFTTRYYFQILISEGVN